MTRRGFLALPAVAAPRESPSDEFRERLAAHCNSVLRFVRSFHGCEPDETDMANCKPWKAHTDYTEFERGRKTAMRLYDLKEKDK
jgi:hypothetical protein